MDEVIMQITFTGGEGNLRPRRPPREYLGEYTSWGKPKIPPADRILMGPGHKARKNPSDKADMGFQAVGPALRWGVVSSKMHTRRRRSMDEVNFMIVFLCSE